MILHLILTKTNSERVNRIINTQHTFIHTLLLSTIAYQQHILIILVKYMTFYITTQIYTNPNKISVWDISGVFGKMVSMLYI